MLLSKINIGIIIILCLVSCNNLKFEGNYSMVNDSVQDRSDLLIINNDSTYNYKLYTSQCIIDSITSKWYILGNNLILKDFKNNFFITNCTCNSLEECLSEYDIILEGSMKNQIKYLKEYTQILSGSKFIELSPIQDQN